MLCPVCKEVALVMADRQGIEVDYCPQCRGVWLDRGELDKIIERTVSTDIVVEGGEPERHTHISRKKGVYRSHDDDEYFDKNRRRKKHGFLGDLFDFG